MTINFIATEADKTEAPEALLWVADQQLGRAVVSSSFRMRSASMSALVTKSPGPFIDDCRFSTSRKSLTSERPALRAALSMIFRFALPCMGRLRDDAAGPDGPGRAYTAPARPAREDRRAPMARAEETQR